MMILTILFYLLDTDPVREEHRHEDNAFRIVFPRRCGEHVYLVRLKEWLGSDLIFETTMVEDGRPIKFRIKYTITPPDTRVKFILHVSRCISFSPPSNW